MNTHSSRVEDEWLVLRSQEGDIHAFERLVARWQDRLWRHARRVVHDDDAAWDILQESWIGMLRGVRRLEDPAAFAKWAYRIVTFKCADHVRRNQRRRRAEDQEPAPRHERATEEDDDVAALRRALTKLSAEQRTILSLHYREEMGLERIAEILGVPVGTVKSRLHYARALLRKRLERRRR